ncbi:MAG: Fur family transcriptional regulator [Rhizobiaceae bacterium]
MTRNQALVYDTLEKQKGPLSAYDILERLRGDGLRAPLQIYRALDKLAGQGRVHRLESLNAFVACREPECCANKAVAFTICDKCHDVAEIANDRLARSLRTIAGHDGFSMQNAAIELHGLCNDCQTAE